MAVNWDVVWEGEKTVIKLSDAGKDLLDSYRRDDELEMKMREAGCLKEGARIVITHFNHGTNPTHERVSKVAERYGYIPAYDGITLEI